MICFAVYTVICLLQEFTGFIVTHMSGFANEKRKR
jgi:hypothetical protein